jgi:hypothetical protein
MDNGGFWIVIESIVKWNHERDPFESASVRSTAQDVFYLGVAEGTVRKEAHVYS